MATQSELADGKSCVAIPGSFYAVYLENGGAIRITGLPGGLPFLWLNPKTGDWARVERFRKHNGTLPRRTPVRGPVHRPATFE